MAISRSLLQFGHTSGASPATTASISPAANSLLLVGVVSQLAFGPVVTVSGLSLTWSSAVGTAGGASNNLRAAFWWAQAGSSPGSGALTISWGGGGSLDALGWTIEQITGHDTASPIGATASNAGSGTAPTVTLAAARAASSRPFVLVANNNSASVTPDAAFAELYEDTPMYGTETQWRSDAYQTTNTSTLSASAGWIALGVEVAAPAAPPVKNLAALGVG